MMAAPIPLDEAERLAALAGLHVLDTPPEERFDRVTRLCQRLFGVPMAFVNLVNEDRLFMKSAAGMDPAAIERRTSFCGHAVLDPDGLVVEDTADDERFDDNPLVTGEPFLRFYAGVPLEAPGGQRVGTLCIADTNPRRLSEADRALLRDLALWVQKELHLSEELDKAAEVQQAMFPATPVEAPGWDIAGACRPSRAVGGDFYDWYRSRTGPVVALGDVMGKGMPAAIVMASVRAALRAGGRQADLAAGVQDAAWSLADDLEATATFSTAAVARLGPDGAVDLVDAGHGHVALVRAGGGIELLEDGGLPLGIDVGEEYAAARVVLAPGDVLLLHSDGLIELPGGPRTTGEAAALIAGATSAAAVVGRLLALCDGVAQADDVTVVAVRRA